MKYPFEFTSQVMVGDAAPLRPIIPTVVVVGAGGTGARVAALLPKLMMTGRVYVVDPDSVEERNLLRQHFIARDVGMPKAAVVSQRLMHAWAGQEVRVEPFVQEVSRELLTSLSRLAVDADGSRNRFIILGCVDNPAARVVLNNWCASRDWQQVAYLDAGNSTRYGQVVLSLRNWPAQLAKAFRDQSRTGREWPQDHEVVLNYPGIQLHTPTLLQPQPDEEEACGVRVDTQTVSANQFAATVMGSVLAALLDGLPISHPLYEFSTLPTMVTPTPFRGASIWRYQQSGRFFAPRWTEVPVIPPR